MIIMPTLLLMSRLARGEVVVVGIIAVIHRTHIETQFRGHFRSSAQARVRQGSKPDPLSRFCARGRTRGPRHVGSKSTELGQFCLGHDHLHQDIVSDRLMRVQMVGCVNVQSGEVLGGDGREELL